MLFEIICFPLFVYSRKSPLDKSDSVARVHRTVARVHWITRGRRAFVRRSDGEEWPNRRGSAHIFRNKDYVHRQAIDAP